MLPEQDATSVAMQYVFKGGEAAIKITGTAAENLAKLLFALLQEKNRDKGQVKVSTLVKKGTPLMTFPLPSDKREEFVKLAKSRGVMYHIFKPDPKQGAISHVDVLTEQLHDAVLKDILEKLGLGELPVSGKIESTPISKEMRMKNEKEGVTTVYDHEVIETAERPTISGRRNTPSAQLSKNSLVTEKRPSVRDALKSFKTRQAPIEKTPTVTKKPHVPTK